MSIARPSNGWKVRREPVHPGEMLREEFLVPFGLSANRLAIVLRVPVTRIGEIVKSAGGSPRTRCTPGTVFRDERGFLV